LRIAVIPAGERWADGSLRPAIEDHAGAGAILVHLPGTRSPEAQAAIAVWRAMEGQVRERLRECASGRELVEAGFAEDVHMAAEVNCSSVVPVLMDGGFFASE
jgi:2-phosphosulfolactate phosphatase